MKKKILLMTLITLLIMTNILAFAANGGVKKTIEVLFNDITVEVNGKLIDKENILYNSSTYLPLRATAEALGAKVDWIQETKTAKITTFNDSDTTIRDLVDIMRLYVKLEWIFDTIISNNNLINTVFSNLQYYTYEENESMFLDFDKRLKDEISFIGDVINDINECVNKYKDQELILKDANDFKDTLSEILAKRLVALEFVQKQLELTKKYDYFTYIEEYWDASLLINKLCVDSRVICNLNTNKIINESILNK